MIVQVVLRDFDVLQNTFNEFAEKIDSHKSLIVVIIVLTAGDLLLSVVRMIIDFRLKDKDKDIHSFSLKEGRRIDALTEVYHKLEEACNEMDPQQMLIKVTAIERMVNQKRIYINKQYRKIIFKGCDYLKSVMTYPRKRNIQTESQFLEEFCKLFEK